MTDKHKIISYITDGNEYYGGYNDACPKSIGNSLHIGVSCDYGKSYKPLNHNVGILFAKADYSEKSYDPVAEGPYTLKNSGRLYMTVAVNATNVSYGIKLLTLKECGNPLLAEDWEAKGYPVLCTAMNKAEPGPGHSSFLRDKNGDVYLVYHWGKGGTHRNTTLKKIAFSPDGEPILY